MAAALWLGSGAREQGIRHGLLRAGSVREKQREAAAGGKMDAAQLRVLIVAARLGFEGGQGRPLASVP